MLRAKAWGRSVHSKEQLARVLVIVNSLALGGTQINAVEFASALRSRRFESVLAGPLDTLPDGPSLLDIGRERDIPIVTFVHPGSTFGLGRVMARLANAYDANIVHVYGSGMGRAALWGPCLGGRRPFVFTVYEMAVEPATPVSPHLIVGARYLAEQLAGRKAGVKLVSPPVDAYKDDATTIDATEFINSFGVKDQTRIVWVGRLDEPMKSKSLECLIDAMSVVGDSRAVLIVVGSGDAAERLQLRAENVNSLHARRTVIFTGPLSDPRMAYASADIIVGMGGSAARGLSFGKPVVVAGEFGWFQTFTPDSADVLFRNSFWSDDVSVDPVGELSVALLGLIHDRALRMQLGKYGREFAVSNFALETMADRVVEVYTSSIRDYGLGRWLTEMPREISFLARRLSFSTRPVGTVGRRQPRTERSLR